MHTYVALSIAEFCSRNRANTLMGGLGSWRDRQRLDAGHGPDGKKQWSRPGDAVFSADRQRHTGQAKRQDDDEADISVLRFPLWPEISDVHAKLCNMTVEDERG